VRWHVFVDRQVIDMPDLPAHSAKEVEPGVYSIQPPPISASATADRELSSGRLRRLR